MRIVAIWLLLVSVGAAAQPRDRLSSDAYAVFAGYMATTCVGDEANAWRDRLLRYKLQLVPAFRRALADGPPEEMILAIRRSSDARYQALATLSTSELSVVGNVQRLPRMARQSFVDDQAARYVAGYKSNAIAALAILGDTSSRATLARLAQRRDDPLALPAAEALRALAR